MEPLDLLGYNFYAILIMVIYSYMVWGNSFLFRVFQNCILGISAAQAFVVGVQGIQQVTVTPLSQGPDALTLIGLLIPVIIGVFNYTILVPKYAWLSRYTIAVSLGIGMGMGFGRGATASLINLMQLLDLSTGNAVLILILTIVTMFYWIFRKEPATPTFASGYRWLRRIAMWSILVYFSVFFANILVTEVEGTTAWVTFYIEWISTGFGLLA